jgi:hypothetical protein
LGGLKIDCESILTGLILSAGKHPCLVQYFLNPRS